MGVKYLSISSRLAVMCLGLAVLSGWIFRIPSLVQINPTMIAMVPNTALNFILLGAALFIPSRPLFLSFLKKVLIATILVLAVLSLLQDIFHFNFGIDSWISTHWLGDPNPTPGRMAPNTSMAFIFSALVILLIPFGNKRWIGILIQAITLIILLMGTFSFLIYSMKWEFIFDWYRFVRMAPQTATGFIFASIAIGSVWAQTTWYRAFYHGREDKKIAVLTAIILILITLVAGLGGIAGLTALNIKTIQHLLQNTLQYKIKTINDVIESTRHDLHLSIENYSLYSKNSLNSVINTEVLVKDLHNRGFKAIKLIDKGNKTIYTNDKFNENFVMDFQLPFPGISYLSWQNGFWYRAKIPIFEENQHNLQGYLLVEKYLPTLTKEYDNYENLDPSSEILLCHPEKNNYAACFPNRFSKDKIVFQLNNKHNPLSISYAFSGLSGIVNNVDYQGNNVIATYSPVGKIGLGMVIKTKANEILEPIRTQLRILIPLCLLLITFGLSLLRMQVVPVLRKVLTAEKNEHEANMELTNRNKEILLLRDLSSALHSCNTLEEAFDLVTNYGVQLLPDLSVKMFVMQESKNYLDSALEWGKPLLVNRSIYPEDCWALRRGKINKVKDANKDMLCPHSKVLGKNSPPSVCIPMMAQSDIIGLLYIEWSDASNIKWDHYNVQKLNLAITMGEQISLAISNIKLRITLRNQSIRDELTGLYNRRYLEETVNREINRLERASSCLALYMIDIDHFKYYNDTFGHEAGDITLQALGLLLNNFVRKADIACRYGGEEFILILPDASLEDALLRANELHDKVAQLHLNHNGKALGPITISIGLAMCPQHGKTLEELIHNADKALYDAKHQGRNKTIVFEQDKPEVDEN